MKLSSEIFAVHLFLDVKNIFYHVKNKQKGLITLIILRYDFNNVFTSGKK
jgi:hypothetical protein